MITTVLVGTAAIAGTGLIVALLLGFARSRLDADGDGIVDDINALLPQTQCAQCGHPGCRPYAEAIAAGEPINRCPPGGDETIRQLAELLGREVLPLDDEFGEHKGDIRAVIREDECIGCTLCIQACPVDAIVGAPQLMHTVIESECTGCELCLPPCPVDCIDLAEPRPAGPRSAEPHPAEPRPAEPIRIVDAGTGVASPVESQALECIRCGACETACPRALAPQDLFWFKNDEAALGALALDRCIECRRCDRVCPSGIPLTQTFRESKAMIRSREEAAARAIHAEHRFEARNRRLASSDSRVRTRPSRTEKSALLDAIKSELE